MGESRGRENSKLGGPCRPKVLVQRRRSYCAVRVPTDVMVRRMELKEPLILSRSGHNGRTGPFFEPTRKLSDGSRKILLLGDRRDETNVVVGKGSRG